MTDVVIVSAARTPVGSFNGALGSLTAGCYFFFARRAFHNTIIATLAGLLCAFHPFWIVNTAELNDGVLASFLLALCLLLGTIGGRSGGALTSLAFGIVLALLALVRAALLPFAFVGLLWYLWRCRTGWVMSPAPNVQRPAPVTTATRPACGSRWRAGVRGKRG